ncbi:MAG: response regulator [Lachnospiraceae bacterium]
MYKLIMVDDEAVIRKGIRDYVAWESMGFTVAALFEDGKEAIEYIQENEVHVILTDIEMAEVSGLKLAKYVFENELPIRVVIISGYKEFEYARMAIQYNVEHYLLKPISMTEVQEVFLKLHVDLEKSSQQDQSSSFDGMLPELTEQFWISMLVGGRVPHENIQKKLELFKIPILDTDPLAIVTFHIEDKGNKFSEYNEGTNFINLVRNICGGESEDFISYPVFLSDDIIKIIMVAKQKEGKAIFCQKLENELVEKCEIAAKLLKIHMNLKVEKICEDLYQLYESQEIFSLNQGSQEEDSPLSIQEKEKMSQKYKLIMEMINDGNYEELDHVIESIFHECRHIPDIRVKHLLIDTFSMISNRLAKMGADVYEVTHNLNYQDVINAPNRTYLKKMIKEYFYMIAEKVKDKQNISAKAIVTAATQYLKAHYDTEISLEALSAKFYLNQAYMSRIFKQYTGATFTDYLIELRMEKAKGLLRTGNYKVYEVSSMVGYRSEKSFFRIFKQYAGVSPSEFYRGMSIEYEAK